MTLQAAPAISPVDPASFEAVRPRLFGIAYRTLESAAEADDVVQDAWIRWQGTDRNQVRDAGAFLATTTKRLALNVTQSARARRETSIQPWHPEQVDVHADPTLGAERREALELAMLTLSEKLSPPNEPPTYSARRSTTRTGRSQTRSRPARQTHGSLSPAPAFASPANAAGTSAPPSRSDSSTPSSTPHEPEISQRSNSCSLATPTRAPRWPSRHRAGHRLAPGVEFSRELRNDVLAGDITLSVRLWKRPQVTQGGHLPGRPGSDRGRRHRACPVRGDHRGWHRGRRGRCVVGQVALSQRTRSARAGVYVVASQSCCNFAAASVPFAVSLSCCHLLPFGP
jgi:sigma-70-like protein